MTYFAILSPTRFPEVIIINDGINVKPDGAVDMTEAQYQQFLVELETYVQPV
jgi:hypothetical protein